MDDKLLLLDKEETIKNYQLRIKIFLRIYHRNNISEHEIKRIIMPCVANESPILISPGILLGSLSLPLSDEYKTILGPELLLCLHSNLKLAIDLKLFQLLGG